MRCLTTLRGGRLVCLAAWLVLAAGTVRAVDPEKMPPADETPAPAKGPAPTAPTVSARTTEKLYSFEMRDKPWNQVLEWLSELTGLPFVSNFKPTGSFTFIGPRGAKYTVPQIIDIVNEALLAQKYVMIRRTASLTIVPADEKIDPAMVPQVTPDELAQRGKTEIVSVVVPLASLVAEDFAPEVKKMMSPFAEVVAITRANQLMLQDTAGSLQRVLKTIKETEETEKGQADSFSHTCKYVKARDAERILRELLGDPRTMQQSQQSSQQPSPWWSSSRDRDRERERSSSSSSSSRRMHYISADDRTNTVMVTGPADKIAQAREIMRKLDVPQQGQGPVLVGPPMLKTYNVPSGNAAAMAATLQDVYKNAPNIRISAVGASSVMVWAGPEDQFEIAKLILGSSETASTATELVPAGALDAASLSLTLKGMFPGAGAAFIEADVSRNAIIVKGTREQVAEVKAAIEAIGGGGNAAASGNMRIITLDKGSARTLAEALERMLPQMRQNPVRVITPGSEAPKPEPAPEPDKKRSQADDPPADQPVQVASAAAQVLDDPQAGPKGDLPGKKDSPVTITAVGNRLIVTSNDPEALALVSELIRLLTQTPGGEGDFEIIRLRNARAADAARILDEAFNGPRQPAQSQRGGGGGRDGGSSSPLGMIMGGLGTLGQAVMPSTTPSAGRIRVVADPGSNSLLVRASPLDMLEIRRLLEKAIDSGDSDSAAILRTYVIGPLKHSNATEVAALIRQVYQEYTEDTRAGSSRGFGGFGGFGFIRGGSRNVDADGNPRTVTLSVGVDDRTNSLVVWCSETMYADITRLVEQLEASAQDSTRTVRVVSIKGVDPFLVQQAIDAIQGRRTATPSSSSSSGSSRRSGGSGSSSGSSGFVPFGTGGFIPGSQPGSNGGFRGFPGGGFPGGGDRGGGGDRSRGRSEGGGGDGGSRFFADRVKEDPELTLLYDPQQDRGDGLQPVGFEEEQQAPPGEDIRGPRAPVTAEALEELGVLVISGNNQADVEAVVRIIEYIQKLGAGAEVQIQLVPLQFGDATSIATTLSQLFQQVIVGATANVRTPAAVQPQAQPGAASIVLLPLPRFNAILLAAPRGRVEDMIKEIRRLDQPTSPNGRAMPFPLQKASAVRVATLIQQFYATRYPNDVNQVRVTFDESSNTVFVQAAPADLTEIRGLIDRLDTSVSSAVNELRIVPLQNALADEMANLLMLAISQGSATGITGSRLGGLGLGGQAGALTGLPGLGQPTGAAPGAPGLTGLGGLTGGVGGLGGLGGLGGALGGLGGAQGFATKSTTLRFVGTGGGKGIFESGLLEDVFIFSDYRTNSLIISAPARTVDLLLALVRELDVPPAARAEIKIFTLKKADAANTALLLQNLFLGGGTLPGQGFGGGIGGGIGGVGGIGGIGGVGGLGGLATPSITQGQFTGAAGIPRPLMTLGGATPEGAPLIDLRISIDPRSNSVIVAGGPNELEVIEAIVNRLDDANVPLRHNEVYKLKNAQAVDIATALQNFLSRSLQVISIGQQLTGFQEIERDVVIVPEPISNTLLISSTPQYFGDVMRLIGELDALPPQVVIQVLVAEVNLRDVDEFGVELGLQSPVLFQRSLLPGGQLVNNTIGLPGFNFNPSDSSTPLGPLGNSSNAGPGIVGFQGLGNLGTGRVSPTSNIGGFVFAASSEAVSVLMRALKTQQRIDVLSRPQIMTMDGQTALINVGQEIPIVTSSNVTATGIIQTNIDRRNVGVILQVTPRINPDGSVVMRVVPEISSVRDQQVPLGNGLFGTSLNIQHVETTVVAGDGETVAIGGLITKRDQFDENKVPWFGDLPLVGALFRYRSLRQERSELLVILTPHVVRSRCEADAILAEEARRIDWVLSDVVKVHGTSGMGPVLAPALDLPAPPLPAVPDQGGPLLPPPRPLSDPPAAAPVAPASYQAAPPAPPANPTPPPAAPPASSTPPPAAPPELSDPLANPPAVSPGKEKRWKLFGK